VPVARGAGEVERGKNDMITVSVTDRDYGDLVSAENMLILPLTEERRRTLGMPGPKRNALGDPTVSLWCREPGLVAEHKAAMSSFWEPEGYRKALSALTDIEMIRLEILYPLGRKSLIRMGAWVLPTVAKVKAVLTMTPRRRGPTRKRPRSLDDSDSDREPETDQRTRLDFGDTRVPRFKRPRTFLFD